MKIPWKIVKRRDWEALLLEVESLRAKKNEPSSLDIRRDRFEKRLEAVARSVTLEGVG